MPSTLNSSATITKPGYINLADRRVEVGCRCRGVLGTEATNPDPSCFLCLKYSAPGKNNSAMFFSSAVQVVFKSTGGRIWNKRWGLPRLSQTRKENRKKDIKIFNQNIEILKAAQHLQPDVPVRLAQPLPQWQQDMLKTKLDRAQRLLNLRGSLLPPAAANTLMNQRQPSKQQLQSLQPPQDPQQQQHWQQRRQKTKQRQQ